MVEHIVVWSLVCLQKSKTRSLRLERVDAWTIKWTDPTGLRNFASPPPPPPIGVHGDLNVEDDEGDGGCSTNGRKNEI